MRELAGVKDSTERVVIELTAGRDTAREAAEKRRAEVSKLRAELDKARNKEAEARAARSNAEGQLTALRETLAQFTPASPKNPRSQ